MSWVSEYTGSTLAMVEITGPQTRLGVTDNSGTVEGNCYPFRWQSSQKTNVLILRLETPSPESSRCPQSAWEARNH